MINGGKKRDCYFYSEFQDMRACIPNCAKNDTFGKCPCDGCAEYFSKFDAHKVVIDYLKKEKIKQ